MTEQVIQVMIFCQNWGAGFTIDLMVVHWDNWPFLDHPVMRLNPPGQRVTGPDAL